MPIDHSHLRALTARELVSDLAHQLRLHPDGRRVTLSFHRPGETFDIKTLRTMIEIQARWTDEDLKRLKVLR